MTEWLQRFENLILGPDATIANAVPALRLFLKDSALESLNRLAAESSDWTQLRTKLVVEFTRPEARLAKMGELETLRQGAAETVPTFFRRVRVTIAQAGLIAGDGTMRMIQQQEYPFLPAALDG